MLTLPFIMCIKVICLIIYFYPQVAKYSELCGVFLIDRFYLSNLKTLFLSKLAIQYDLKKRQTQIKIKKNNNTHNRTKNPQKTTNKLYTSE